MNNRLPLRCKNCDSENLKTYRDSEGSLWGKCKDCGECTEFGFLYECSDGEDNLNRKEIKRKFHAACSAIGYDFDILLSRFFWLDGGRHKTKKEFLNWLEAIFSRQGQVSFVYKHVFGELPS